MKILLIIVLILLAANIFFGDGHLLSVLNDYDTEGKVFLFVLGAIFVGAVFLIFLKVVFNHFLAFPDPPTEQDNEIEAPVEPEAKTEILDE